MLPNLPNTPLAFLSRSFPEELDLKAFMRVIWEIIPDNKNGGLGGIKYKRKESYYKHMILSFSPL